MAITIFVTGGTFDKEYNEITGELFFKDTHIREILELGRAQLDVKIKKLMLVDSLNMTDEDRSVVLENCVGTKDKKIVRYVLGVTNYKPTTRPAVETIKSIARAPRGSRLARRHRFDQRRHLRQVNHRPHEPTTQHARAVHDV